MSHNPAMPWPYHSYQTWPSAVDPFRRTQRPAPSPQYQQLISLINERTHRNTEANWDHIRTLQFTPDEIESATDYTVNLYTRWLAEDFRVLWPLLGGRMGRDALQALLNAGDDFGRLARDRERATSNVFAVLLRLCSARWVLRVAANELSREAAGR